MTAQYNGGGGGSTNKRHHPRFKMKIGFGMIIINIFTNVGFCFKDKHIVFCDNQAGNTTNALMPFEFCISVCAYGTFTANDERKSHCIIITGTFWI